MSKPCKYCGLNIDWGYADERWVTLVPIGEDSGLDRQFQDENGILRASHKQVCSFRGSESIRLSRLAKTIKGSDLPKPRVDPETGEVLPLTLTDTNQS